MAPITVALTRLLAGIPVPDTQMINGSIALARASLPDEGFNHVMRAWLNGQAIINRLPAANRSIIDEEAFGVAAILHDLGWSPDPEYISQDKRFEVDGAIAARAWIQEHGRANEWPVARQQLVWDSIAIHTTADISRYAAPVVSIVSAGTFTEILGPTPAKVFFGDMITVTQNEWQGIVDEFPRPNYKEYHKDVLSNICRVKPQTTYENGLAGWGEKYVANYTRIGHRFIDFFEANTP
ncbi:hypothetical protein EJ04DRAFT_553393 [Polyplosphaeria fusca]|uniref:HD domain-containing protein n=1 Tax=Polyplosphaeria fusca TaxID=682080 RepID=A0A9P4V0D3_9PLEO|nr:hypothetical protein EJ04DRAFT_553393 [Polyplosphaeria fusca]